MAPPRYFTPANERLLAGEHPGVADRRVTMERIDRLLGLGVTLFVDLTNPRRENVAEYRTVLQARSREAGLRPWYVNFPIQDGGVPASPLLTVAILDTIDAGLSAGERVYVHCKAGIGRTGTLAALHLVRHGLTGHAALRELAQCWKRDDRSRVVHRCPETSVQVQYVRDWPRGE